MHVFAPVHSIPGYRPDIDGLRAIAVLLTVVFHAYPTVLPGGFVGVDVFFVISGYLISGIVFRQLSTGSFSLATFYANRIRRIFPALLAVLVASAVAGWYLLLPQEFSLLGKHIASGAGFVQNIVLQREAGYFDTASDLKPLLHLWSLAIEDQFYMLYPLLMLLAWRAGAKALGVLLLVAAFVSFALNLVGVRHDLVFTFFWPHTRVWELLFGAGLAYAQVFYQHSVSARTANALSLLGLASIGTAAFVLSKTHHFPGAWALMPVLGAAAILLAGPQAWVNARLLSHRAMVAIGLISYPLYLWHWPLLSFTTIVHGETPSPLARSTAVAASFGLAWLTYRYLEQPLRFGPRKAAATTGLVVALGLVGTAGYAVHATGGAEHRFPLTRQHATYDKWTWGRNPECAARYPHLASIPYCLLAPDAPAQVALIGDSHANHYYPGLVEQGLNVINLGKGSCLGFFGVTTHIPLPRPQGEICPPDHLNLALQFAIDNPHISHIALTGRFQQYHDEVSEAKIFTTDAQGHTLSGNPQVFSHTLDHTLARLVASGKHIVFILDNPDILFDPKECIELPALRSQQPIKNPCATSRSSIEQRHSAYRATALTVLAKYPTVQVFDPFNALCDATLCCAARGPDILYRDTDHLSLQGSRLIATTLAPYLTPAASAGR